MPDIKTDALERCIGIAGEHGPGCLDGLCARKGECQYPEDCPSPRAVADAAIKELTALRARVERGEADRVAYLEAALRKIAKREGRFSRDHLTHASNTIEDMATVAEHALNGTWENEEEPSHA